MKAVVVSGATGFVGYHLIKNLQERGFFVIALCHCGSLNSERLKEFKNIKIIKSDASQFLLFSEELKKYKPEIFFHLAWDGTTGEKRRDYTSQLDNVRNTCDAYTCAALAGCKKFVAAGTVYEQLTEQILGAEKFSNLTYYVLAKKYAYETLMQLYKKMGTEFVWCTFCQPIGKYIKTDQLMAYMVIELKAGRIPQFGEGKNPFDMIPIEDLAEGLVLAGTTDLKKKRYYIGSGEPRILKEYLLEAGRIIAPDVELVFGERPDDGLHFSYEWLNDKEFVEETGFVNKVKFSDGVRNVISWIEEWERLNK